MLNKLAQLPTEIDLKTPQQGIGVVNNLDFGDLLSYAIGAIVLIAGIIFFFMLVFGGIRWVLSGGDKAKTEGARNQITAALIGLVIVFSAWAIVSLLGSVFGFSLFDITFDTITT